MQAGYTRRVTSVNYTPIVTHIIDLNTVYSTVFVPRRRLDLTTVQVKTKEINCNKGITMFSWAFRRLYQISENFIGIETVEDKLGRQFSSYHKLISYS